MAEITFEYRSLKAGVKWIKNVYIFGGSVCFTGGIGLIGGSIWSILITYFLDNHIKDQQSNQPTYSYQWVSIIIGLACLYAAYLFLKLYLKEKQSVFYVELYNQIRQSVEAVGNLLNLHYVDFDEVMFEEKRQQAMTINIEAFNFLKSSRLVIIEDIYMLSEDILKACNSELGFFKGYIFNNYNYINNIGKARTEYDPRDNHRENIEEFNDIRRNFENLVVLFKSKVSFNVHG